MTHQVINPLSQTFTWKKLIKFALPNIAMLIFISLYSVVDGFFVARFVNDIAIGSLNIVFPLQSLEMALAFMLATGASAIVAKQMGEHKPDEACQNFTLITGIAVLLSLFFAIFGNLFIEDIMRWLGASELQLEQCCDYGFIILLFAPAYFLQHLFQVFFVTAGRPGLGLIVTLAAGLTNMLLDYLFMGIWDLGIKGAAWATISGYMIVAITGLIFFTQNKKGTLYIKKPVWRSPIVLKSCTNGASEMVSNLAVAITTFLFNYVFMKFFAEAGVSAISIVLYLQFIFTAIFFGFSGGVAPIISYKFGNKNNFELKGVIQKSLIFIVTTSAAMFILSHVFIDDMLTWFVDPDTPVYQISIDGFPKFAFSFLFMGISIFASAMFTALSDGKTSAIISFGRTFVFLAPAILLLPLVLEADGAWLAVSVAELLGAVVSIFYLIKYHIRFNKMLHK
jgi:Na+-driven multidrug efflux pump